MTKSPTNTTMLDEKVIVENSKSVAFRDLPPVPKEFSGGDYGTILLFYQYKEPVWTAKEHKKALKKVIEIGTKFNIKGRGRVAPEGLNCTLTGMPNDLRSFCKELRTWDKTFEETDFKLTDGVPLNKLFKSLSIRKTDELVAYGLSGDKAPSLEKFAGEHLEAEEYHKAMADKDTVIVDVRNAYESALGSFKPPPGGAQLIDPQMRNSIEFPKWLNDPATQEKLNGKKVLMYCTGGIRCERATALLNQMSTINPNLKPKGVYELRGGIERYIKTFPEGGFWKGKNYLFDRRMEQLPGSKSAEEIESNMDSKCCVCREKCNSYRGKFTCSKSLCGVPVIVCEPCSTGPEQKALTCELCKIGYKAPDTLPDLVGIKRKAEAMVSSSSSSSSSSGSGKEEKKASRDSEQTHDKRLFLARLPLTTTQSKIKEVLKHNGVDDINIIHWLTDKTSGGFYGSCVVEMKTPKAAKHAAETGAGTLGYKIDKKRIKVGHAVVKEDEVWPPVGYESREFPPL